MHLAPGMMVSPNVRLTRPLGEGAMGCVWVADHLTLKTHVAVKFISGQLAMTDPEILERFVREASTAAQIKSPHVVQTFDQGVMADGTPYIVLELLEGETMQEMLDRVSRLTLSQTAQVMVQVARALGKAHDLGIVHRDIKPDNIFLTPTEDGLFAKILDFGIAKQTQLPKMGGLTNPGVMVGTPEYMAPEQVLSARDVDFRADLWALAVTAYCAITGELPFTAEALGTLCVKLLDGSFTPPSKLRPDLHAGFDAFFLKAMAHAPSDRFQSAREMARRFNELVASTGAVIDEEISIASGPLIRAVLPSNPRGAGSSAGHPVPLEALVPTAPLPTQPMQAKSETLTGSASNRHQPDVRRSWPIAAAVLGAVAVIGVVTGIALIARKDETPQPAAEPTLEPAEPAKTAAPVESAPAALPTPEPVESAAPSATVTPKTAPLPRISAPIPRPKSEPSASGGKKLGPGGF